jgi:hypothetical protein
MGGQNHQPFSGHEQTETGNSTERQAQLILPQQPAELGAETFTIEPAQNETLADSDRYAYSPRKRREIVQHYRDVRDSGLIENKDRWAQSNYHISGRTLLNYAREFPEDQQKTQ